LVRALLHHIFRLVTGPQTLPNMVPHTGPQDWSASKEVLSYQDLPVGCHQQKRHHPKLKPA
jgi:hypothetical protein